jgi:hypothetical protein
MWSAATMAAEGVCCCTDQSAVSVLFTAVADTLPNALVRRTSARRWDRCCATKVRCHGRAIVSGALCIACSRAAKHRLHRSDLRP